MPDEQNLQQHNVERLAADRRFLAWYLRQYCAIEKMTYEDVAKQLEISSNDLPRLALCIAPDPAGSDFTSRIQNIAAYTGANTAHLAQFVRLAIMYSKQTAKVFPLSNTSAGMLLAAREQESLRNEREQKNDETQ